METGPLRQGAPPSASPLPGISDLPTGHPCRPSGLPDIKDPGPSLRTSGLYTVFSFLFQTAPSRHPDPKPSLLGTSDPCWLRPQNRDSSPLQPLRSLKVPVPEAQGRAAKGVYLSQGCLVGAEAGSVWGWGGGRDQGCPLEDARCQVGEPGAGRGGGGAGSGSPGPEPGYQVPRAESSRETGQTHQALAPRTWRCGPRVRADVSGEDRRSQSRVPSTDQGTGLETGRPDSGLREERCGHKPRRGWRGRKEPPGPSAPDLRRESMHIWGVQPPGETAEI